nr:TIR domain-containing protein [Methanolinea mesophila]
MFDSISNNGGKHTSEKIREGNFVSQENKKLKVFISYSHADNTPEKPNVEDFKTHVAPLKTNGSIEEWYDRHLLGGDDFQEIIGQNLEKADIICLFVSAKFLASPECQNEKKIAFTLRKLKGIPVIPIILSQCAWKDDPNISHVLAYPDDGKPITSFNDPNDAWHSVYLGIKAIVEREQKIKQLSIRDEFQSFLFDTELLNKAHSQKESVSLKDIYIETELEKFDIAKKSTSTIKTTELFENLFSENRIIIAGEDQSGKTTIAKRMFCELRKLNFIPVYISGDDIKTPGKIDNILIKSLRKQYQNFDENVINLDRIVPIVDDFHLSKDKEKRIKALLNFPLCVIIIDDIFGLNFKDESLISSFITFRIKELKPSIRSELIKRWLSLNDKEIDLDTYQEIDKKVELINVTLGRNIGKGLIPAYPFFILSALITYEAFALSLNEDITSQGYCYHAFLVYYLKKRNVESDDIDTYFNFMSEFASFLRQKNQNQLNFNEFSVFMEDYSNNFNLHIKPEKLLKNLSDVVIKDGLNNFSFKYPCFYYFFVGKTLSENLDKPDVIETIKEIFNNLQNPENAYIAVFIIHHSKNVQVLNEIETISLSLFNQYDPATLSKDEMAFFDEEMHNVIRAILPSENHTPEMHREQLSKFEDDFEENHNFETNDDQVTENKEYLIDLRKAVKTVEVMGVIIRNRSGSLEKDRLRNIFLYGMNVHLRILTSLINSIKSEESQKAILDYMTIRLSQLDEKRDANKKLSEEDKRKMAQTIFWNMCFIIVYGNIFKIVNSLGSDKLIEISNQVCDEIDNPATALIKYGILMKYLKNIPVEELHRRISQKDFSLIAKRSAEMMIVGHCALHNVGYRQRQQIESTFHIERAKLT